MSPDPHTVIPYEQFEEWRARRRPTNDEPPPPPASPPTNDADVPPAPRDPRQSEATAWRQT